MRGMMVSGIKIGNVVDFRRRFMQAQIGLDLTMRVGDLVHIVGPDTDFRQTVSEIEFYREKVDRGKPAQKVWIPVKARVRAGDAVVLIARPDDDEQPPAAT